MYLCTDQGLFHAFWVQNSKYEFTWTAVEFEIIFLILSQDALAEL